MRSGDRHAVALVDVAAFVLTLLAAVALGLALLSESGSRLGIVALVASLGGLLFLGLGVIRRAATPPFAE
jgi:hypothetical protein